MRNSCWKCSKPFLPDNPEMGSGVCQNCDVIYLQGSGRVTRRRALPDYIENTARLAVILHKIRDRKRRPELVG